MHDGATFAIPTMTKAQEADKRFLGAILLQLHELGDGCRGTWQCPPKPVFDLRKLCSLASDLDLVVDTAEEDDGTVRGVPYHISGTVQGSLAICFECCRQLPSPAW